MLNKFNWLYETKIELVKHHYKENTRRTRTACYPGVLGCPQLLCFQRPFMRHALSMVSKLIGAMLRQRLLVVALSVLLLVGGLYAFKALNIEAYPDPSPPTIEVIAQNPGWSAEEMERQITVPIETQLNGMPGLDHLRSISLFGLTDIKCYFKYDTDYNFDRQEVLNRLQMVQLPPSVQPQLSPTSAVG